MVTKNIYIYEASVNFRSICKFGLLGKGILYFKIVSKGAKLQLNTFVKNVFPQHNIKNRPIQQNRNIKNNFI